MIFLERFILLLCMHALFDYAIQIPWKDPANESYDRAVYGPWWWAMLAHCLLNGLGVWIVLGSFKFLVLETIFHFMLDTLKSNKVLTTKQDQFWHIASKVYYAAAA